MYKKIFWIGKADGQTNISFVLYVLKVNKRKHKRRKSLSSLTSGVKGLKADASSVGLGAFLEQNYGNVENEKWHPISYIGYEKRYAQITLQKPLEKHQILACVF